VICLTDAFNPARPLVFVSHSLGGILVKEVRDVEEGQQLTKDSSDVIDQVLRRSESGRQVENFAGYEAISRSLCGIIFMGTPHHGGNYGSLGKAVESVVKHLGFDTNDAVLRELHENSQVLEIVHEEFIRLLDKRSPFLTVYTFVEAKGLTGLKGFNAKVRLDISHLIETPAEFWFYRLLMILQPYFNTIMKSCISLMRITETCVGLEVNMTTATVCLSMPFRSTVKKSKVYPLEHQTTWSQ
jgi:hypothetical protein